MVWREMPLGRLKLRPFGRRIARRKQWLGPWSVNLSPVMRVTKCRIGDDSEWDTLSGDRGGVFAHRAKHAVIESDQQNTGEPRPTMDLGSGDSSVGPAAAIRPTWRPRRRP